MIDELRKLCDERGILLFTGIPKIGKYAIVYDKGNGLIFVMQCATDKKISSMICFLSDNDA